MPKRLKMNQRINGSDGYFMCRINNNKIMSYSGTYDRDSLFKELLSWCKSHTQGSWAVSRPVVEYNEIKRQSVEYYYFGFQDEQDLLVFQFLSKETVLYPMWPSRMLFRITEQDNEEDTTKLCIPLNDNNLDN